MVRHVFEAIGLFCLSCEIFWQKAVSQQPDVLSPHSCHWSSVFCPSGQVWRVCRVRQQSTASVFVPLAARFTCTETRSPQAQVLWVSSCHQRDGCGTAQSPHTPLTPCAHPCLPWLQLSCAYDPQATRALRELCHWTDSHWSVCPPLVGVCASVLFGAYVSD